MKRPANSSRLRSQARQFLQRDSRVGLEAGYARPLVESVTKDLERFPKGTVNVIVAESDDE
jgi:hypothetical protein